jgi:hypothetical protein
VTLLHKITGLGRATIKRGQNELAAHEINNSLQGTEQSILSNIEHDKRPRIRKPGGGRKKAIFSQPNWVKALEQLIDPVTIGNPESTLRWTIKSKRTLSEELRKKGFIISPSTVMRQLHSLGYSLQSNAKKLSGSNHPDRNSQFEYINKIASDFLENGDPVISVDTKKKEIIGNFKNNGQTWSPKGCPAVVNDHDFPDPRLARAFPFGIYDIKNNIGHIVVGTDHDTSEFAVNSIYGWWQIYGNNLFKKANKILITADCGGSNGYRLHLWKYYLQRIANKIKIPISVCHFPPGTSKWNKIEHKLFSFISSNWRGTPLIDYETVVNLISSTKTESGLSVSCILDVSTYNIGKKLTKDQISSINIVRDEFHGEWNYTIYPCK